MILSFYIIGRRERHKMNETKQKSPIVSPARPRQGGPQNRTHAYLSGIVF